MKITKIRISNFRWFNGEYTFDFCMGNAKPADVVLMYAPNGSGKTSFTEAIEWTFSGKIERIDNLLREFKTLRPKEGYILKNRTNAGSVSGGIYIHLSDNTRSIKLNRSTAALDKRRNNDYAPTPLEVQPSKEPWISQIRVNDYILSQAKINEFLLNASAGRLFQGFFSLSGRERDLEFYYRMRDRQASLIDELDTVRTRIREQRNTVESARESILSIKAAIEAGVEMKKSDFIHDFSKMVKAEYLTLANSDVDTQRLSSAQLSLETVLEELKELDSIKRELRPVRVERNNLRRAAVEYAHFGSYLRIKTSLEERIRDLRSKESKIKSLFSLAKSEAVLKALASKDAVDRNRKALLRLERQSKISWASRDNRLEGDRRDFSLEIENLQRIRSWNDERATLKRNHAIDPLSLNEALEELFTEEKKIYHSESIGKALRNVNVKEIPLETRVRYNITADIQQLQTLKDGVDAIDVNLKRLHDQIIVIEARSKSIGELKVTALQLSKEHNLDACPVCNTNFENCDSLLDAMLEAANGSVSDFSGAKEALESSRTSALERLNIYERVLREKFARISEDLDSEVTIRQERLREKRAAMQSAQRMISQIDSLGIKGVVEDDISGFESALHEAIVAREILVDTQSRAIIRRERQLRRLRNFIDLIGARLRQLDIEIQGSEELLTSTGYTSAAKEFSQEYSCGIGEVEYKLADVELNIKNCCDEENVLKELHKSSLLKFSGLSRGAMDDIQFKEKDRLAFLEERRKYYRTVLNALQGKIAGVTLIKVPVYLMQIEKLLVTVKSVRESLASTEIAKLAESKEAQAMKVIRNLEPEVERITSDIRSIDLALKKARKFFSNFVRSSTNVDLLNDIYRLIDPNLSYRRIMFEVEMSKGKENLFIKSNDATSDEVMFSDQSVEGKSQVSPALFFSEAQSNILSISLFLNNLATAQSRGLGFVIMDDPVQSMDDINAYAFVDLCRIYAAKFDKQLIITTHDLAFFELFQERFPSANFDFKYLKLDDEIKTYN